MLLSVSELGHADFDQVSLQHTSENIEWWIVIFTRDIQSPFLWIQVNICTLLLLEKNLLSNQDKTSPWVGMHCLPKPLAFSQPKILPSFSHSSGVQWASTNCLVSPCTAVNRLGQLNSLTFQFQTFLNETNVTSNKEPALLEINRCTLTSVLAVL